MSDQETMNRAFAQAVATGTSTIVVSMPNRAGKSTLHRQIQQTKTAAKVDNHWLDPIELRYGITIDEAESIENIFNECMALILSK